MSAGSLLYEVHRTVSYIKKSWFFFHILDFGLRFSYATAPEICPPTQCFNKEESQLEFSYMKPPEIILYEKIAGPLFHIGRSPKLSYMKKGLAFFHIGEFPRNSPM